MSRSTTDILAEVPLFAGLSGRQLRNLAKSAAEDHYDAGATIVLEGGRSDSMFVVVEGTANVVRDGETISRRGPGEFFGEIAMIDGRPRAATVVAETEMTCVVLHQGSLRKLVMTEPQVAWALVQSLAARLRGE